VEVIAGHCPVLALPPGKVGLPFHCAIRAAIFQEPGRSGWRATILQLVNGFEIRGPRTGRNTLKNLNRRSILRTGLAAASARLASAQGSADCGCTQASDNSPLDTGTSELRPMIERYDVELRDLNRVYALHGSHA